MDVFTDGSEALTLIPIVVVFALMASLVLLLASVKGYSKNGVALLTRGKAIGFFAFSVIILPFIAWALFSPVFLLFMTLPMKGEVSSWGPAKYIAGAAPFTVVCLGAYFFAGARMGVKKKALLPGAIISMLVLFGPIMCSYARVEWLSVKHINEFRNNKGKYYLESEEIAFMKVFEHSETKAKTFGVVCAPSGSEAHGCFGSYYFYERDSFVGKWELVNYSPLWGGDMDELPWPPY